MGARAGKGTVPHPSLWREPATLAALATRDIGAVYRALAAHGWSQRRIATLTGQQQSDVSAILAGRRVVAYDLLSRIADRLGVPRALMGLARTGDGCARCGSDPPVTGWTGVEARMLRQARRMTVQEFGAYLGVSDRMISKWEAAGTATRPRPVNQAALDTALAHADQDARRRFAAALANRPWAP